MIISKDKLPCFVCDPDCLPGIQRVAAMVMEDLKKVFGAEAGKKCLSPQQLQSEDGLRLVFGVAGKSALIDDMASRGLIDLSGISGKREVFGFFPISDDTLVIAGSDKRGTIYGLFHLSELLDVSPFVNWSALTPAKKESFVIDDLHRYISKEPSVEYRGFFINDEWPAFGTWCNKHFGGFTAQMYEGVFELLLRLKGNYLWPAMWTSCFAEDGPGLKSAELADELGVVMGLSHHEPCLRHGEEYSHVRGKDSVYGDAWSFISNREGITRFWRDGLKRNGHLENVITVGMRGERDSTILGQNATLADNINLLRDVIRTQEQLIREEVGELSKVPRMLALYKEVEAYYFGDENTPGLKEGCPELEDVILMLCDDNHGYLRSLPDEQMRKHPGGFGMYYHFDYHGGPVSYEWINSTHLPEVWQQMTTAYEYGIKRLWIVNVGDLGLQELPLSYFLELAYDFDKWGTACGPDSPGKYMEYRIKKDLGQTLGGERCTELAGLILRAERMIHNRRPEHMGEQIYHPQADHEVMRLLAEAEEIEKEYLAIEEACPAAYKDALYELAGYSLLAGMNLIKLWMYRVYNHYFAGVGAIVANKYSDMMAAALDKDEELKERLHSAAGGKWDGFGEALHIGFKSWNSEECRNPVMEKVRPVKGAALVAGALGQTGESRGLDWTKRTIVLNCFDKEDEDSAVTYIYVAGCGEDEVAYKVENDNAWISADRDSGTVSIDDPLHIIRLTIDKKSADGAEAKFYITCPGARIEFCVCAPEAGGSGECFRERGGVVIMDAAHFTAKEDTDKAGFTVIPAIGRREDAVGIMPVTAHFDTVLEAPYIDYSFDIAKEGEYTVMFQLLPCNPWTEGRRIKLCYSLNNAAAAKLNVLPENYFAGETYEWGMGVMNHVHYVSDELVLGAGINTLRIYGTDPENLFERIILVRKGVKRALSYMGPDESKK